MIKMFKIHTIGGYSEVGKNMTAVEFEDDVIIFDAGLYLPAVIDLQESTKQPTPELLRSVGALPEDKTLEKLRDKVRGLLITHAHLDHVGAVQYVANRYPKADIYGTPYTIEVLKALIKDTKLVLKNKLVPVHLDSSINIKGLRRNYQADFINMTHSTIQSTIIALHSPDGIIIYANDYKLDNNPTIGAPPNYNRLKELGKKGVKVLVVDSLYSGDDRKTHSEKIARAMIEEVMLTVEHGKGAIVITTFSSHIARLKSIVEFSKRLDRKVVFVGRSLAKYVNAARTIHQCPFEKDIQLISYTNQVKSKLKQIDKSRHEYVLVCTGHQGEANSILDRIVNKKLPFIFHPQDSVIFSSKIIPTPINVSNRANMEKKLKMQDVRIFGDVHVSGHGGREDLRDLVNLLKPIHVIPSHGGLDKTTPAIELAKEMGYKFGKTCYLSQDGGIIEIN